MNKLLLILPLLVFIPISVYALPWGDQDYRHSRLISINNDAIIDNLDSVIYLNITTLDLGVDTQEDCDDILFFGQDNLTSIPFEIETCDAVNDILEVRIRGEMFASFLNFYIIQYDNVNAVNNENPSDVYTDGTGLSAGTGTKEWKLIAHLNDDFSDSTGNGNTGINSGTIANTTGYIGHSRTFDGVNDYINFGTSTSIDDIFDSFNGTETVCTTGDQCGAGMVSLWFNPRNETVTNSGVLLSKTDGTSGWEILYENGKLAYRLYTAVGEGLWETDYNPTNSTFNLLSVFMNDDEVAKDPIFFLNGDKLTVGSGITEVTSPTGEFSSDSGISLCVGNTHATATTCATTSPFEGEIDEIEFVRANSFEKLTSAYGFEKFNCENQSCINSIGAEDSVAGSPTSFTVTAQSESQIVLEWVTPTGDGSSTITGYQIERESPVGNGFSVIIADTGNTDTVFDDFNVISGKQYNYKVSAININGAGQRSSEAFDTTPSQESSTSSGGGGGSSDPIISLFSLSVNNPSLVSALGQMFGNRAITVEWSDINDITVTSIEFNTSPFEIVFQDTPFVLKGDSDGTSSANIIYSLKSPSKQCGNVQTLDCVFLKKYTIPVTISLEHEGISFLRTSEIMIDFGSDVPIVTYVLAGLVGLAVVGISFGAIGKRKKYQSISSGHRKK